MTPVKKKAPRAFSPTRAQKARALPHVYEAIDSLLRLNAELARQDPLKPDAMELTLLRLRLLWQFFESRTREADSVLARDFDFPMKRVVYHPWYRRRVNRRLAPLTYKKTREKPIDWPFHKLVPPVLERAERFAKHLLKDDLFSPPKFDNEDEARKWTTLYHRLHKRDKLKNSNGLTLP